MLYEAKNYDEMKELSKKPGFILALAIIGMQYPTMISGMIGMEDGKIGSEVGMDAARYILKNS